MMAALQSVLLDSYESLSSEQTKNVMGEYRDACEWLLDDYFCRKLLAEIPDMVQRLLRFDEIVVGQAPSETVQVYHRQAVRSYVFGLHQAAVALARAALEQALREQLPKVFSGLPTLDSLLDAAAKCRLVTVETLQTASDVQHAGNRVLHRRPCDSQESFDVLVKTRAVLEVLYGGHAPRRV